MAVEAILNFVLVIFVLLCLFVLYDYLKKKRFLLKNAKNIPYLPYLPVIGSVHLLYKDLRYPYRVYQKGKRILDSDHYFLLFWNRPIYMTANANDLQVILPNVLDRGFFAKVVLNNIVNNCLLTEEVPQWKVNRKIMNKSFKQQSLNAQITSTNESVNDYLTTLSNKEKGVDFLEKNKRLIMENFFKQYFPYFHKDGKLSTSTMVEYIKLVNNTFYERAIKPWLYIKYFYNMTEMKKNMDRINDQTGQIATEVIKALRINLEDAINEDTDDVIINLEKGGIDRDVIISEFKFLVAAATDTQGFTLTMAAIALGTYPEIQENVFKEVLEVVGLTDYVTQFHLQHLKYTEMFVKETIRLFPPVCMVPRRTGNTIHLGNDKVLPKDMEILISLYDLHRHEKYWKNPLEFDPNRFRPEEIEKRHPFAFVPFSVGARNCIGYKYAMITLVVSVALLVRKYRIGCTHSHKSILDIEMRPLIAMDMVDESVECTFTTRQINEK